jgi:hypothetical protein
MPTSSQAIPTEQSPFKLPRSSYNELVKIIMAYGKVNKPASLDEISQYCGVGRISVSSNNAFLSAVGVIEGGKAKIATQKGLQLARALEHELADEIVQAWRQIVFQNSFLHKMVTAVKIRRGFETSAFESHIAYSSGEPRSPGTMTGARTVIDILRSAMVIKETDGKLQVVDPALDASAPVDEPLSSDSAAESLIRIPVLLARSEVGGSGVSLVVQLRLDVKVDDLESLGAKLRKMMADFNRSDVEDANDAGKPGESVQSSDTADA